MSVHPIETVLIERQQAPIRFGESHGNAPGTSGVFESAHAVSIRFETGKMVYRRPRLRGCF